MNTPKLVSHDQLHKAGLLILERVAPNRAIDMILELAMYPFEDVMYSKIKEANELYSMSFR